jgi:hypothetical protein
MLILVAGCGGSGNGSGETGACCQADGTCSLAELDACAAGGGVFHGKDTACDPNPCQQLSACCLCGTCFLATEPECAGHFFADMATGCDPHPCCAANQDCPDHQWCDQICQDGCRAYPDNCQTGVCDPQTRVCVPGTACCTLDQACADVPSGQCAAVGLGEGTSCAANPCPPISACCFDGACQVNTQAGCLGHFIDTAAIGCDPNPCCGADTDCAAEEYCAQVCLPGCRTNPDNCQTGSCDPADHVCR